MTETLEYLLRPPVRHPGGGLASAEDADSEGDGGPVLRLGRAEVLEVGGPGRGRLVRRHRGGQLGGPQHPVRPAGATWRRPPRWRRAGPPCSPAGDHGSAPASTTRCSPSGTPWRWPPWPRPAPPWASRLGRPRRRSSAELPARPASAGRGRALAAQLAGRARRPGRSRAPRLRRRPRLAGRGVHPAGRGHRAGPVDRRGQAPPPTRCSSCSTTTRLGAFHMTGHDAEALIARPIDSQDGAVPSANSVAATALLRLAALDRSGALPDAGRGGDRRHGPGPRRRAVAFTGLVAAAELARSGMTEVVVTGDRPDLVDVVRRRYLPGCCARLGRAVRLAAVGGPHRHRPGRPGVRVPRLRLPGAHRGRRAAGVPTAIPDATSMWLLGGYPPLGGPLIRQL